MAGTGFADRCMREGSRTPIMAAMRGCPFVLGLQPRQRRPDRHRCRGRDPAVDGACAGRGGPRPAPRRPIIGAPPGSREPASPLRSFSRCGKTWKNITARLTHG